MITLIPAFEPDGRLVELISCLDCPAVVVDDGSGPAHAHIFEQVRLLGAHVLTRQRNRGKGYANNTGFAVVRRHFPGALRFTGEVPARSRFGNTLTRKVFRLATCRGSDRRPDRVRGYPPGMLAWLCRVGGERFEVEIATIYLEHNASSHFHPLRASIRVYGPLLAFGTSSLLGFAVDSALLFVFTALTGNVVLSAVAARLISAVSNYTVNRTLIFRNRRRSASRSAVLAAILSSSAGFRRPSVRSWPQGTHRTGPVHPPATSPSGTLSSLLGKFRLTVRGDLRRPWAGPLGVWTDALTAFQKRSTVNRSRHGPRPQRQRHGRRTDTTCL